MFKIKKEIVFLFILFFSVKHLNAQKNDSTKIKNKKFGIELLSGTNLGETIKYYEPHKKQNIFHTPKQFWTTKPIWNYQNRLTLLYCFQKNAFIGIGYQKQLFQQFEYPKDVGININKVESSLIGIKFFIGYTLAFRKFNLNTRIGIGKSKLISYCFFLNNTNFRYPYYLNLSSENKLWVFFIPIDLGVDYPILKSIFIGINSNYDYYLNSFFIVDKRQYASSFFLFPKSFNTSISLKIKL